jgi:hypothetical protein
VNISGREIDTCLLHFCEALWPVLPRTRRTHFCALGPFSGPREIERGIDFFMQIALSDRGKYGEVDEIHRQALLEGEGRGKIDILMQNNVRDIQNSP